MVPCLQMAILAGVMLGALPLISSLVQHILVPWQVHSFRRKVSKASIARRATEITIRTFLSLRTRLEIASFAIGRHMAQWKSEKPYWDLVPTIGW